MRQWDIYGTGLWKLNLYLAVRKLPVIGRAAKAALNFFGGVKMDMADVEKFIEAFLGEQGEAAQKNTKVIIASGYNVLDKMRRALDALNELTEAVSHARNTMKDGYEKTRAFISPGVLQNFKETYTFLKKFGIIAALENMVKK